MKPGPPAKAGPAPPAGADGNCNCSGLFPVIEIDCSMSAGALLVITAIRGLSCAFRDNVVQLPRSRIRRSPILDHHAQLGLEPLDADVNVFLTTTPLGATLSLNLLREYYLSRSRPELPSLSSLSTPTCASAAGDRWSLDDICQDAIYGDHPLLPTGSRSTRIATWSLPDLMHYERLRPCGKPPHAPACERAAVIQNANASHCPAARASSRDPAVPGGDSYLIRANLECLGCPHALGHAPLAMDEFVIVSTMLRLTTPPYATYIAAPSVPSSPLPSEPAVLPTPTPNTTDKPVPTEYTVNLPAHNIC